MRDPWQAHALQTFNRSLLADQKRPLSETPYSRGFE